MRLRALWSLFFLLGMFAHSHAHILELSGLPASAPDPQGDWKTLVIPFNRVGNLILIEAKIDSVVGNFILDTGAPYLVLNKTYFRDAIDRRDTYSAGVDGNSSSAVQRKTIPKLQIGRLFYTAVEADVTSLGQLENKRGVQILGLLGLNLFTQLRMSIDMQQNQIVLERLSESGAPLEPLTDSLMQKTPEISMEFRLCDNKVFLPVVIAGQKMNWILDTGAETSVVDAMARKKVLDTFRVRRRTQLTGTGGVQQEVLLGVLDEMQLGSRNFRFQQALVTGMRELSETCSVYIDGILGYTFLQQGRFVMNFKTKEFNMYLYSAQ